MRYTFADWVRDNKPAQENKSTEVIIEETPIVKSEIVVEQPKVEEVKQTPPTKKYTPNPSRKKKHYSQNKH